MIHPSEFNQPRRPARVEPLEQAGNAAFKGITVTALTLLAIVALIAIWRLTSPASSQSPAPVNTSSVRAGAALDKDMAR